MLERRNSHSPVRAALFRLEGTRRMSSRPLGVGTSSLPSVRCRCFEALFNDIRPRGGVPESTAHLFLQQRIIHQTAGVLHRRKQGGFRVAKRRRRRESPQGGVEDGKALSDCRIFLGIFLFIHELGALEAAPQNDLRHQDRAAGSFGFEDETFGFDRGEDRIVAIGGGRTSRKRRAIRLKRSFSFFDREEGFTCISVGMIA